MDMMGDRMPPQNNEAEQSVLGSILLQPSALISSMEFIQASDFIVDLTNLFFKQWSI